MSVRKRFPSCPNCGSSLQASHRFCQSCGQENHDLNIPLWHLIGEFLENTIHFDSKSLKTVRALALRPGFLTNEFNAGRRKSYVPPLRLYIFISFTFFLLLNLSWNEYKNTEDGSQRNKFKLSFSYYGMNSNELIGLAPSKIESLMTARNISINGTNLYAVRQLHRITNGGAEDFYHLLLKNISYSLFALMPLFGLLMFIFYRRDAGYYFGSLVHSLHLHTFGFIALSLFLIVSRVHSSVFTPLGLIALLLFYFYRSQRTVFKQSRLKIISKSFFIIILYAVSILAIIVLATWILVLLF